MSEKVYVFNKKSWNKNHKELNYFLNEIQIFLLCSVSKVKLFLFIYISDSFIICQYFSA